MGRKKGRTRNK